MKGNRAILKELMGQECFAHIAGFTSSAWPLSFVLLLAEYINADVFEAFAPHLYNYYKDTLGKICEQNPELKPNFPDHPVFANQSTNYGPNTVAYLHRDFLNLAWGWCAVTALGFFDADEGGHLILWDCGLIIRFPPGSTILLPSAMIAHANLPIKPYETRYSLVQYSAAALFRWVRNGHMTDKVWDATATVEQKAKKAAEQKTRWQDGLAMFSTLDELRAI
jgi:hypothetical protein